MNAYPLLKQYSLKQAKELLENSKMAVGIYSGDSILVHPEILKVLLTAEGLELLEHLMELTLQENSPFNALNSCLAALWKKETDDVKEKLVEMGFKSREFKGCYLERWVDESFNGFTTGASEWKDMQKQRAKTLTISTTIKDKMGLEETTVPPQLINIDKASLADPDTFKASIHQLKQCDLKQAKELLEHSIIQRPSLTPPLQA